MTPKEKADELFEKFNNPDTTYHPYVHNAQQCALIAVDEIIEALLEYDIRNATYELQNMDRDFNYWEQVKQEIEKL